MCFILQTRDVLLSLFHYQECFFIFFITADQMVLKSDGKDGTRVGVDLSTDKFYIYQMINENND